jgi:K+/H+ antiporter YhaU regulatory subunit KhtT
MINVMKEAHEYAKARIGKNRNRTYRQNLISGLKKFHAIARRERMIESFPALEGSEKQIKWAIDIRIQTANALDNILDGFNLVEKKEQQALKTAVKELMAISSAKWWIENRGGYEFEKALIAQAKTHL